MRKVVRMILPHDAAVKALGEEGVGIQALEDRTNTSMRVYQWMLADGSDSGLPFLLVELWGRAQAIVDCVVEIGKSQEDAAAKEYEVQMLVPESRLSRLNMEQLNSECKSARLSDTFAIVDPMPCRTLSLSGGVKEIQTAMWTLIGSICED